MAITASIVLYKTDPEELRKVVECTARSSVERIWLVDNSPTDAFRKSAETLSDKVEYLYGHGNIGYGKGHNIAIAKAVDTGAKYHIVVNPDICFEDGTVESLAACMDADPGVGQLMPRVLYPDGELQYLCKLLPTPLDLIGRRFIPFRRLVDKRNRRFEMRGSGYDKVMEVPYLSGCFMFCRTEALKATGGFSDRYFMYCEDLDLCRRIGRLYKTVYYPKATVVHAHKKESFKNRKLLIEHIKSAVTYFNTWGWLLDSYRKRVNRRAMEQYR